MSLLDIISKIFSFLFGGKKEPVAETKVEAPVVEKKMAMKESVFAVMTSSESEEWKTKLRAQMAEKDAVETPEYKLYTDAWEYIIRRPIDSVGVDHTKEYGTQFVANPLHSK